MKDIIKKLRTQVLTAFAGYMILGLMFIIWPAQVSRFAGYVIGAAALVLGVERIIYYFKDAGEADAVNYRLVIGLIAALAGLYIIWKPYIIGNALTSVFSVIIIIDGIIKLQRAIDLKRTGAQNWWLILIFAVLTMGAGIFVLINPDFAGQAILRILGFIMLFTGLSDLWTMLSVSKKVTAQLSKLEDIETEGTVLDQDDEK